MVWWTKDDSQPFCRYLSDAKNRVPCQKHQCLSYVEMPLRDGTRFGCRDEFQELQTKDQVMLQDAIFKDQERLLKLTRGIARAQLTGRVDDELIQTAQLEKKQVRALGNSD